jgi:ribosome biogenesis protein Tsr3
MGMFYEVILDSGETANKCTIAPLSDRPDFRMFHVRAGAVLGPLRSPLLLHPDGECLTAFANSKASGVAAIDCVWRRLEPLLARIEGEVPKLARIPAGFETAYPRKSKWNVDPASGLATIEAIFIASAILGSWDLTLLSRYAFAAEFLSRNRERFVSLGVASAALEQLPPRRERARNALQRKLDRGRRFVFS